ncbi:MAG: hypothetical protein IT374_02345 [Polyangiaceae bacterium]|nr:hypothetical protein [Polyangiaceae bacterium]
MIRRASWAALSLSFALFAAACVAEEDVATTTPINGSAGQAGDGGEAGAGGDAGAAGASAGAAGTSAGAGGQSAGAAGASAGAAGSGGSSAGAAGAAGSPGSGVGDSCADLAGFISIDEAPVVVDASSAAAKDDLSASCTGKGTTERVFRFRPLSDGLITFTAPAGVWPSMYTLTKCGGGEATCTASGKLVAPAIAGQDITLVVETLTSAPYQLTATPTPSSPKDMCSPAGVTHELPDGEALLFEGDTAGGASTVAPTCGAGASGGERAYRVRPLKSGTLSVELRSPDGDPSLDGAVYVRDACDAKGKELACASSAAAGATETTSFAATAGVTYFVVVDTVGAAAGPFELRVALDP